LQGFTSKQDGLVNAGDISKTRVENPKDYLKRDQDVWVKVISLAGGRIRLSMRDVDQQSGRDLVPMGKPGDGRLAILNGSSST
jgi:ATP-dependent RNA helicase DHX8/PRP22